MDSLVVSFSTADYANYADLTLLLMGNRIKDTLSFILLPIKSKFPAKRISLSVASVSSVAD
jgi:hypothetical protein